jgi:hypothetical protein
MTRLRNDGNDMGMEKEMVHNGWSSREVHARAALEMF